MGQYSKKGLYAGYDKNNKERRTNFILWKQSKVRRNTLLVI